jgi:hypothetical protein
MRGTLKSALLRPVEVRPPPGPQISAHLNIEYLLQLGPLAPEYHTKRRYSTQNKPKRDNRLVHRLLVRDQGVGGSNPLSPTIKHKRISNLRVSGDPVSHIRHEGFDSRAVNVRSCSAWRREGTRRPLKS